MRHPRMSMALTSCLVVLSLLSGSGRAEAVIAALARPLIRGDGNFHRMRLDPKGRFLAYENQDGMGLSVLDLKSRDIYVVTDGQVGASFVWSPDGYRLFYREQMMMADGGIKSSIRAFDCGLFKNVTLEEMSTASGFLTFDPRDLRLQIMGPKGVRTKKIYFPGERLARWQVAQRIEVGKWLATQQAILWLTQGGLTMRKLEDDGSGIDSFDISPRGDSVVWATRKGRVYLSRNGETPVMVAFGRDPRWHPERPLIIFAGARVVGNKNVSYDLRLADDQGVAGRFLTATQYSDERWPQWQASTDRIIYTMAKATDVYTLELQP